jgi:hypothetical protein
LWIVAFQTRFEPVVGFVSPYRFHRLLTTDMEVAVAIDPVIVLVEELRSADATLRNAAKVCVCGTRRERALSINRLLSTIRTLNHELLETVPTSALGAAELIRLVIERLPFSHMRYVDHFSEVARRLECGQRTHADLVWLRAMQMSLANGGTGDCAPQAGLLLRSAIFGAARPILVFRAAVPAACSVRAKGAMALPPN